MTLIGFDMPIGVKKYPSRIGKIKTALLKTKLAFVGVPFKFHVFVPGPLAYSMIARLTWPGELGKFVGFGFCVGFGVAGRMRRCAKLRGQSRSELRSCC